MTKEIPGDAANAARTDRAAKPTREMYDELVVAYDHFNRTLFEGQLPACLITLQRSKKSYGYFSADRFANANGALTDEIALNPAHFTTRAIEEVLATLVHEMVHLWQHHFGSPGRGRYHNREWAEQMKAIGLQPTADGTEGGAETGEAMSHAIVPGGAFEKAVARLVGKSFRIAWADHVKASGEPSSPAEGSGEDKVVKAGKWFKFECPDCQQTARAKYDAALRCGLDDADLVRVE